MHKQDALRPALDNTIRVDGRDYRVITRLTGRKNVIITTRVYLEGERISAKRASHGPAPGGSVGKRHVAALLRSQHEAEVALINTVRKAPSQYMKEAKDLLRDGDGEAALMLLTEALGAWPDDPFILSYWGCLSAVVKRDYEKGIEACKRSLGALKDSLPFGQEIFYPELYLNLGRAFLAAGRKRNAIYFFKKGLTLDQANASLHGEMKMLGQRREPPVPGLKRSNPINKYIGMLLRKPPKAKPGGKQDTPA